MLCCVINVLVINVLHIKHIQNNNEQQQQQNIMHTITHTVCAYMVCTMCNIHMHTTDDNDNNNSLIIVMLLL